MNEFIVRAVFHELLLKRCATIVDDRWPDEEDYPSAAAQDSVFSRDGRNNNNGKNEVANRSSDAGRR